MHAVIKAKGGRDPEISMNIFQGFKTYKGIIYPLNDLAFDVYHHVSLNLWNWSTSLLCELYTGLSASRSCLALCHKQQPLSLHTIWEKDTRQGLKTVFTISTFLIG